jgi:hypothetical protein
MYPGDPSRQGADSRLVDIYVMMPGRPPSAQRQRVAVELDFEASRASLITEAIYWQVSFQPKVHARGFVIEMASRT